MDAKYTGYHDPEQARFNPRARDGRERSVRHTANGIKVSIHAPVMDAKRLTWYSKQVTPFQSTRP